MHHEVRNSLYDEFDTAKANVLKALTELAYHKKCKAIVDVLDKLIREYDKDIFIPLFLFYDEKLNDNCIRFSPAFIGYVESVMASFGPELFTLFTYASIEGDEITINGIKLDDTNHGYIVFRDNEIFKDKPFKITLINVENDKPYRTYICRHSDIIQDLREELIEKMARFNTLNIFRDYLTPF